MSETVNSNRHAGDHLRHPLVLVMLVMWGINDHYLKAYYGNWWTGKGSDVCGLVVFSVALYSSYEVYWAFRKLPPPHLKRALYGSLLITGGLLAGINLVPSIESLCSQGVAYLQWPFRALFNCFNSGEITLFVSLKTTMDPSDLLTLPALMIPYWIIAPTLNK